MKLSLARPLTALGRRPSILFAAALSWTSPGCAAEAPEATTSESELVATRIYDCQTSSRDHVGATLQFTAEGRLKGVDMRGVPAIERRPLRGDYSVVTGRNAAAEYFKASWVRADENLGVDLSFKSRIKTKAGWAALGLDDSLLGVDRAVDGSPMGKLRIDIGDAELEVGTSYHLSCTKTESPTSRRDGSHGSAVGD